MRVNRLDAHQWARIAAVAVTLLPWMACVPGSFPILGDCVPAPTISSISPTQVAAGSPQFALQITGKDFHSNSVLLINGQQRTTIIGGEHELSALIEVVDVAQPGAASIVVVTPPAKESGCGGGSSNPVTLRINP